MTEMVYYEGYGEHAMMECHARGRPVEEEKAINDLCEYCTEEAGLI